METMKGVETYLNFTVESGEDFEGGWLPTLDTNLKVDNTNQVQIKFYEKDTCSKKTVQMDSAMEENAKIQTVSNDLVRRLCNTGESLGAREKCRVVDSYAQKLSNSGYSLEQVRRILVNGIKGFEGRKLRCQREGRPLYRKAVQSQGARMRKKLLAKTSWYKGAGNKKVEYKSNGRRNTNGGTGGEDVKYPPKTVLFVEQTMMGGLGKKLRELMTRLTPILGFRVE